MKKLQRFVALCVLVLAIAAPARADDVADEADLHFSLATEAYQKKDFRGALEHFLASNRLVPNRHVVFNIARTYEQLNLAADAYRYYALAAEGETDVAAKKRAEDALARIAPQVAVVRVTSDPPGATIFIDRKDLGGRGNTPRSLALPPGKHRVILELANYEAKEIEVELAIGAEVPAELVLAPILGQVQVDGSPFGAEIRVDREDGPPAGHVPGSIVAGPGKHTLFVTRDGFDKVVVLVDVTADALTRATAVLAALSGTLVVNSDVGDTLVTVDGKASGFTPAVLHVPVGAHRLRLSHAGFRSVERDVVVQTDQEARIDAELSVQEEVSAASRTDESVDDAPASVTIISSQELRAMAYPTIAEALRGVRGLYLSDDRAYPTVGVRGFSNPGDYGNRILVMIDGQPTNDNYIWASYVGYAGRVDLDDIERIEVVRGPGSVLYGTGAFFGVINLVTRDRNTPTKTEVGASSVGFSDARVRATQVWRASPDAGVWSSISAAKSFGSDMYYSDLHANPTNPNAEVDVYGRPIDGTARDVDGFTAATVSGRAWYKTLTLQWFLTSAKKQLPNAPYDATFNDPRTHFADTRGFVELRYEPRVSKSVELFSRAHANLYNFDDMIASGPPDGSSRDTYRGKWAGIEQRIVYSPSSALRLTVGGETIRHFETKQIGTSELTNASYIYDDAGNPVKSRNDPLTEAAGYVLADIVPIKGVKISTGARLDYYSNLDRPNFTDLFNPRVAVIIKPYDRGNIKIMTGKAFRMPSVYELYFRSITQVPSVNLRPEEVYSGEIEYSHRFTTAVTGTVAGYVNHVSNLIQLESVPVPSDGFQYQNSAADVRVYGGELELRRDWKAGWMASAVYSVQKAVFIGGTDLRDVPNSPLHLGSLKAAAPIIGRTLVASTRVSVQGPRFDRNFRPTDPPQTDTDTGVIWDLVLSGEAPLGIRYAIGAYNITNWRYDTVPSSEFRQQTIIQAGRTFLASTSVTF